MWHKRYGFNRRKERKKQKLNKIHFEHPVMAIIQSYVASTHLLENNKAFNKLQLILRHTYDNNASLYRLLATKYVNNQENFIVMTHLCRFVYYHDVMNL